MSYFSGHGPACCLKKTVLLTPLPQQGDNWNDLLKNVITFNSVEEFWGVYVRSFLFYTWHRHLVGLMCYIDC